MRNRVLEADETPTLGDLLFGFIRRTEIPRWSRMRLALIRLLLRGDGLIINCGFREMLHTPATRRGRTLTIAHCESRRELDGAASPREQR